MKQHNLTPFTSILIACTFFGYSLVILGQQKPSASQDIKLNEEARKQIDSKMTRSFEKYPNSNEKLSGTDVTYLFLGDIAWKPYSAGSGQIIEVTSFDWRKDGNVAPPQSELAELNDQPVIEWQGSAIIFAKYVRVWNQDTMSWGRYLEASQSACKITVSKAKGSDWTFSPLMCQSQLRGSVFNNDYSVPAVSLTRHEVNLLEKNETAYDDFLDRIRIANGNSDLQKAKEISARLVNKVFRLCSDGKWYTSTISPKYDEIWLVHQFEGFKWKVKESTTPTRPNSKWEGKLLLTAKGYSLRDVTSGSPPTTATSKNVLYDLRITKTDERWTINGLEENDADLIDGAQWMSFEEYKGSGNAMPYFPLKPRFCP